MVVEVPCHERDVDVSRLANRFAIVHALEHGEETRVLLDTARERIQPPRSRVRCERPPRGQRGSSRGDRRVYVTRRSLTDSRQERARCRITDVECLTRFGPVAANKMAEDTLMLG